ncbi:MAG: C39 family peptidase [Candidatus Shapirobacteria bacterium]|nr:C39 family peptidase [Candidatus Shapirobacteria bacterium]
MANNFPNLKRIAQVNSYYCGPATLQMLLSCYDIIVSQQEIVDLLHINQKIVIHGMTIPEMGQFVKTFYPQYQFWYKFDSSIPELSQLINQFNLPVGVEWQGVFDYDSPEEADDDDPGHYSVVTELDTKNNKMLIADPYEAYAGTDRQFSILQFERRWWDINEVNHQEVDDYHGLFIITPLSFSPPASLQLLKP